jgi:hypothetical protein
MGLSVSLAVINPDCMLETPEDFFFKCRFRRPHSTLTKLLVLKALQVMCTQELSILLRNLLEKPSITLN